jgi:flavoprotein
MIVLAYRGRLCTKFLAAGWTCRFLSPSIRIRFRGFRLTQLCFNSFYYFIQIIRYMFRSYDHLQAEIYTSEINKMVVRPKHVADNLNKIVNNYWNRDTFDGSPWTWSNTRKRMKTPKFKLLLEVVYQACCDVAIDPTQEQHKILCRGWKKCDRYPSND